MPLLHKQIVSAMRQSPTRGKTPLEVLAHPLGVLVSMVAGEMASPPLQANVGAIFYVTRAEMIQRGIPVDTGIRDLSSDIQRQLVYADPQVTRRSADDARKTANGLPGTSGDSLRKIADRLDQTADKEEAIFKERAKGRPASELQREIDFSQSFFQFRQRWSEFYFTLVHDNTTVLYDFLGNELPDRIDAFYAEYITYVKGFETLGGALTKPPPPPSKSGDAHLPDIIVPASKALSSVFKPILYGGLALGAGLVVLSVYRPGSTPSRA